MSKKILICDDEAGVHESLKLILADFYELILVNDGGQCLDTLDNARDVGLVLLDIKMPDVNGLEILKRIKEKHPDMKVIMITGYKSVETAGEATSLGAAGYIVKPFESKTIMAVVQKALQ